jgi:glycosyltransferase involved in cell wall biosynthesis
MADPLRILFITGEYPPQEGGVGDFTHILGKEMVRQGAEVAVLASRVAGVERTEYGVVCYPWVQQWQLVPILQAVNRAIQKFKPDILDIQYQTAAYQLKPAINLLPRLLPIHPWAVTFHDLRVPYLFPKAGRLRWWVNLHLARSCRVAIVTNHEDQTKLLGYSGIKRTELIPIGSNIKPSVSANQEAAFRQKWQLGSDKLVLCYFGFLNESKGAEELIAALDCVRKSGFNAVLLMIGGQVGASDPTNAAYLKHIKHESELLGLEPHIIWTGFMKPEEVSGAFACADMCVLPYRDGVSFRRGSLMAALSHGLPIISTLPPVPLPELLPGENIMLVPVGDYMALAKSIIQLAQDLPLRTRLAGGATELASKFTWSAIATRTLEVLHAATGR